MSKVARYNKSLRTQILEVETPERLDLLEQAAMTLSLSPSTRRKCLRTVEMKRKEFRGRLVVPVTMFNPSDYVIGR